jgi:hypothetical protein
MIAAYPRFAEYACYHSATMRLEPGASPRWMPRAELTQFPSQKSLNRCRRRHAQGLLPPNLLKRAVVQYFIPERLKEPN